MVVCFQDIPTSFIDRWYKSLGSLSKIYNIWNILFYIIFELSVRYIVSYTTEIKFNIPNINGDSFGTSKDWNKSNVAIPCMWIGRLIVSIRNKRCF